MVLKALILSFILINGSSELYNQHNKKADKILSKVWEDQVITLNPVNSGGIINGEIHSVQSSEEELLGYLIFNTAPSRVDIYTYLTVFAPDGAIKQVSVLEYRENYGGEIASKRFLKQFIGKKGGEQMGYPEDIDGISGATLSVKSLSYALKRDSKELITYLNTLN